MTNSFAVSRVQLIYALCLPLAVVMGYLLADPTDRGSVLIVSLVLGLLSIPVLITWNHPLLILSWNAVVSLAFLPGSPDLWMLLAFVSLFFAIVHRATDPDFRFITVPPINRALFFFLGVVIITALVTGGFGMRSLGSARFGAKGYVSLLAAIAGYFALSSQRIPVQRAGIYVALFFLSGLTGLIPNLINIAGGRLSILYCFFPPAVTMDQVNPYYIDQGLARVQGLVPAALALSACLMARYGLRGLFDLGKPYRLLLFLVAAAWFVSSGYRTYLIIFLVTVGVLFCYEGLFRFRTVLRISLVALAAGILIVPNADKLPLVVQRTISFLPVRVNTVARVDAEASSDWRMDMWREVLPEVPKRLLLGRGCGIDPNEMNFAFENAARGYVKQYSWAIVTEDYHNGPLSVIMPFGIWGLGGFCWFLVVSLKYLHRNYRHGDPALQRVNTFLFAFFTARVVTFFLVFGAITVELFVFTGLIGLSVALNGSEPYKVPEAETESEELPYEEELVTDEPR
jgi:hypothetical protein